jgi:hypothetical protein
MYDDDLPDEFDSDDLPPEAVLSTDKAAFVRLKDDPAYVLYTQADRWDGDGYVYVKGNVSINRTGVYALLRSDWRETRELYDRLVGIWPGEDATPEGLLDAHLRACCSAAGLDCSAEFLGRLKGLFHEEQARQAAGPNKE